MHILIIPRTYPNKLIPFSGVFVKEQAEALEKKGFKIGVLVTLHVSFRKFFKVIKMKNRLFEVNRNMITKSFFYIRPIGFLNNKIRLFYGKQLFKKYVKINGIPDIVHLHVYSSGDLAIYLKNKYNIPYVVTEHSTEFKLNNVAKWKFNLAQRVYRNSNENIAVSENFKNFLSEKFNVEFSYIPNIVDTDYFKLLKGNSTDKKDVVFLNVALATKKKNQELLIKSFHRAFKNKSNYRLIIAGEGPEIPRLKKMVNEPKLTDRIALRGRVIKNKILKIIQGSDYRVLSSTYEKFGVVLIEAMSCGLPVSYTKSEGPISIVQDE
ncbi:glycosyltransferase, partial [bacterium]|nr:glycosyltransferase [bacterium]